MPTITKRDLINSTCIQYNQMCTLSGRTLLNDSYMLRPVSAIASSVVPRRWLAVTASQTTWPEVQVFYISDACSSALMVVEHCSGSSMGRRITGHRHRVPKKTKPPKLWMAV